MISLKGISDNVLSDYFWARAVILTSPTVATLGLALTIPMGIVSDALLNGMSPTWILGTGALLVLSGFVCVNMETSENSFRGHICCWRRSESAIVYAPLVINPKESKTPYSQSE